MAKPDSPIPVVLGEPLTRAKQLAEATSHADAISAIDV
jgi:hypothetical protein